MKLNKKLSKNFLISLFWKQNKWHRHGVLIHTLRVVYYAFINKKYDHIVAGFLHDFGKPFVAFQDENDKLTGEYSFTNHEEISYHIIKKWNFISEKTKNLVRFHYLIRDMNNSKKKNKMDRYKRLKKRWDNLEEDFQKELGIFLKFDDLAKI